MYVDRKAQIMEPIEDFIDGSGITECPDCGEIVEPVLAKSVFGETEVCPYCGVYDAATGEQ
tara:strand:+ start:10308 stop:10490 length:183 start_codon:yes stop_codon:yes gene_type:complete